MFRCFSTLRNVFDTNKRVFNVLRLILKALQPFTRGFPSDPQRDIYTSSIYPQYCSVPGTRGMARLDDETKTFLRFSGKRKRRFGDESSTGPLHEGVPRDVLAVAAQRQVAFPARGPVRWLR